MRLTLMIMTALLLVMPANAIDDGYSEDGYTYDASSAYWCKGGSNYTREKVSYSYQACNSCGQYYQQPAYYYKYSPVVYPAKPVIQLTSSYDVNSKLLIQGYIDERLHRNNANATLELAQQLGYVGAIAPLPATPLRYAYGSSVAYQQQLYGHANYGQVSNTYGANGNTVYGSANLDLSSVYGTFDANAVGLLTGASIDAFKYGLGRTADLATLDRSALARFYESVGKGVGAQLALKAAEAAPSTQTYNSGVVPQVLQPLPLQINPAPAVVGLDNRQLAAVQSCVACHSGAKLEGGFDVTKHWQNDQVARLKVVQRLVLPPDDPRHMPKGGPSLPPHHVMSFLEGPKQMGRVER